MKLLSTFLVKRRRKQESMKQLLTCIIFIALGSSSFGQTSISTVEKYIQKWKYLAIKEMEVYHIPASITLAQGILESGSGESLLARKANNHFGIKCHGWEGETIRVDDDKKKECFRKYKNAIQSYIDHSKFLANRSRYAFLFDLKITDYKGWARGLKKAGYATNPRYPKLLIDLIERYKLNQYDRIQSTALLASNSKKETKAATNKKKSPKVFKEVAIYHPKKHEVLTNQNKTKYVIAGKHDTFYLIAKEFGINLRQLNRWNDFPKEKALLSKGDKVYIMRKRKNIPDHLKNITLKNKEAWKIAQEYGVQLLSLVKKNTSIPNDIAMK